MTPAQFRNRHGNPTTWSDTDFDSWQNIQATSHEGRLAYRARRAFYPVYQAALAVQHISSACLPADGRGPGSRTADCPLCQRNLAKDRLTTAA